jgi:hypothetical protein
MAMKTEKIERDVAPDIEFDDPFRDDRAEILERLNKANPEFVHMYQRPNVGADELERKSQEIVKG